MKVLILQTCDGHHYKQFLDLTQSIHEKYCDKHGYTFMRHDGVINGLNNDPSFATFNRIYLLQEIYINKPEYDWVFYIDADCVIKDINKTVDEFLHNDKLVVGCRGANDSETNTHDINIGVAFYNMRHPKIQYVLNRWQTMFENDLNMFRNNTNINFSQKFDDSSQYLDDQYMFHQILKEDSSLAYVYIKEKYNAFNYNGSYLEQILRDRRNTLGSRIERMKDIIKNI
jgi:hypothetical protein